MFSAKRAIFQVDHYTLHGSEVVVRNTFNLIEFYRNVLNKSDIDCKRRIYSRICRVLSAMKQLH